MEAVAKNWDLTDWILSLEINPGAVFACATFMLLFLGIIGGGILFLILAIFIPRVFDWFYAGLKNTVSFEWAPAVFFRVLILIFASVIISGFAIGNLWNVNARSENLIGLVHTLIIDLLACASVLAVLKQEGVGPAAFFGKSTQGFKEEIKRGLLGYIAAFPVFIMTLLLVMGVSEWLHYEPPAHPLVQIFLDEEARSPFVFRFALILAAFAAPIFEEIFFRGFCYRLFKGWWGVPAAMGMSAALFAGMHGSGFAFFPIFILGLALAWLYENRGCLTACWTFHILHNILFTGYFFSVKALMGTSL